MDLRRLLGPTGPEDREGLGWCVRPVDWAVDGTIDGAIDGVGDETGRGSSPPVEARATLSRPAAADLAARLRGLGFDGQLVECRVEPPLPRAAVRRARSEDARRRRATTPGFERRGAQLDTVGRWSLTPEHLALALADAARALAVTRVVDAGCGLGGNAIAFARAGLAVTAIERDGVRLDLARRNAELYGVAEAIRFVRGEAQVEARRWANEDALLFVDAPWGPDWSRARTSLADLPLLAELLPLAPAYAALWAKLPPSFAVGEELPGAAAEAVFGAAEGDWRRVKFVLARVPGAA